jgi:DNA-binding response OmpR family regulator
MLEVVQAFNRTPITRLETDDEAALNRKIEAAGKLLADRDAWLKTHQRISILRRLTGLMESKRQHFGRQIVNGVNVPHDRGMAASNGPSNTACVLLNSIAHRRAHKIGNFEISSQHEDRNERSRCSRPRCLGAHEMTMYNKVPRSRAYSLRGDVLTNPEIGAFSGHENPRLADDPSATSQATWILLVESDFAVRNMLTSYLEENNIRVVSVAGSQEATRRFVGNEPDLIILDRQLGREDGLDLLREIRSSSNVPVIIAGHGRDETDRVVGLELGADVYVTKPFGLRELLARIRAVLRRREAGAVSAARDSERGCCQFGGWELNRRARRLTDPNGTLVALTKSEYALLIAFLDVPQRPLTSEYLLQATRMHEDVFDRSIDVQVLRLRRKLEDDPSAPRVIQTERGVGYVFTLRVEPL